MGCNVRKLLAAVLVLSAAGCATASNQGSGEADAGASVARTGVTCKATAGNVGHSCTNTSHTCSDLADDMKSCCGSAADVDKATCSATVQ